MCRVRRCPHVQCEDVTSASCDNVQPRVSCGDLGEVLLHINRPVYDRRMGQTHRLWTYAPWATPMAHVWDKRLHVLPRVSCRVWLVDALVGPLRGSAEYVEKDNSLKTSEPHTPHLKTSKPQNLRTSPLTPQNLKPSHRYEKESIDNSLYVPRIHSLRT